MSELAEALYRHLLSLLPPGRYPRAGGAADGMVRALAQEEADLIREALEAFPQAFPQYAEGEALEGIGRARGLSLFQGELEAAFRNRVTHALQFWRLAGTLPGVLLWLEATGYDAYVYEHFRDDPSIWAEFSVWLWPEIAAYTTDRWGDGEGVWDDGTPWDYALASTELFRIPALLREVKPAHARVRRVYYIPGPKDAWDDGGVWDDGSVWGPEPIQVV